MNFLKKPAIITLPLLLLATLIISSLSLKVGAVSSNSWQAGRIIDDAIFYNSQTYNADQIQAFLNAKVPTCDTNHAAYGGYEPPYTCLKDYVTSFATISGDEYCPGGLVGGTKSSSQIIAETAVNCGINPQVILVTLQKEQGLVTDDWPLPKQYERATGFACPDPPPSQPVWCDPAFAGFAKQVYYGARQFQRYAKDPDSFPRYRPGRSSRIYYNPDANCGYSDVFVQTQATSSLYTYTPYQPNAGSLAYKLNGGRYYETLYPDCGAYGTVNFWIMFNDWFGPSIGPLIRSLTSPNLYYTDGAKKYIVSSMELAEQYGLSLNDVRYLHQEEVNAIPNASYPLSQVVKSNSDSDEDGGALYLISKGKRSQFASMQQLADFGFQTSDISYMPIGNLYRMYADPNYLSNFVQAPSLFVYKVLAGGKRGIFDPSTLASLNPSGQVTALSDFTLSSLTLGQPYIVGDAILKGEDSKLWLYQEGNWYYLPSLDVYNCWRFGTMKNFSFTASQAVATPVIGTLSCRAQRTDGQKFLMNNANRIQNDNGWGFTGFSTPLNRTIDRISTQASVPEYSVFQSSSSTNLYVIDNGKKRLIPSMDVFTKLGYDSSDIVTIHPSLLASITNGLKKLAPGALVKDSTGKIYIIKAEDKLYVPDAQTFENYGLVTSQITNESPQLLSLYPSVGNLQMRFKIDGDAYFIDNKTLWTISAGTEGPYGISGSTPTYNVFMISGAGSQKTATRFIKSNSEPTIYYLENGQKRPISSWQRLVELNGQNSVTVLSQWATQQFPNGSVI